MRTLSVLVMAFGSVFLLNTFTSLAAEEASSTGDAGPAAGTSTQSRGGGRGGSRFSGRLSYQTSRAAGSDFRSFKASSADESGSMNEGAAQPNTNSLRGSLSYSPARAHSFSLGTSMSLDKKKSGGRNSSWEENGGGGRGGGGGRNGLGQNFSLRYSYRMNQNYSFGVGSSYRGSKLGDPSLSGSYRNRAIDDGWARNAGLSLTVPASEKSQNQHLITRATAKTGVSYTQDRWVTSIGIAHSHPFFNGKPPTSEFASRNSGVNGTSPRSGGRRGKKGDVGSGENGGGGGGRRQQAAIATDGAESSAPSFEDVDMVLAEREVDRTTGSMGVSFSPTKSWKLSTGTGVTYIQTARQKAIWLTSARIISASYHFWKMEAGSDLQLFSDVHKYQHPSLPKLLSVGFHLSYSFGDQRGSI